MKVTDIVQSATRGSITAACVIALNGDSPDEKFDGWVKIPCETALCSDPICLDEPTIIFEEIDTPEQITNEAVKDSDLKIIFAGLAKNWREATGGYSLTMRRYAHASYQSILALEPKKDVTSLILLELQQRPDRWFEALKALTNANPAQDSKTFDETVQRWIEWGKSEKFIS